MALGVVFHPVEVSTMLAASLHTLTIMNRQVEIEFAESGSDP
jgi:hypothetical protein